jgi:hypothetical protein
MKICFHRTSSFGSGLERQIGKEIIRMLIRRNEALGKDYENPLQSLINFLLLAFQFSHSVSFVYRLVLLHSMEFLNQDGAVSMKLEFQT